MLLDLWNLSFGDTLKPRYLVGEKFHQCKGMREKDHRSGNSLLDEVGKAFG